MKDDRFGVVVRARDAWANAEELHALGARCVRTKIDDLNVLDSALREHPADVRVIVTVRAGRAEPGRFTLDRFTSDPSGLDGWARTVRQIGERFAGRVWALECLGDWSRLGIEPEVAVAYALRAGRILRDTESGIVSLLGSISGPHWMARLREIADLLSPDDRALLGGACFQPFEKNARGFPGFDHSRYDHGEIDVAVQNAHDLVGLPIWVTGFGLQAGHAGGTAGQARYLRDAVTLLGALPRDVLAAATYHCWWDRVDASHERREYARGLRRAPSFAADRVAPPRPAWHAFAEIMNGTGIEPTCFAAGACELLV